MSLFLKTSNNEHFIEHHGYYFEDKLNHDEFKTLPKPIYFRDKKKCLCFFVDEYSKKINTHYYVGLDWITSNKAIYVQPKLNNQTKQETDYIKMLFSCFKHPEVSKEIDELVHIKWNEPKIEIEQKQDLLTPFLVVQYLNILKVIVRKGLKKSYYKVENNLQSRVKGKILIGQTIKQNLMKNKILYTYCSYEEFGFNNLENRLLKKAFLFVQRYLPTYSKLNTNKQTQDLFNFISPAFKDVSEEVSINEIKHSKYNAFYKEYSEAIHLAKLIIKRFGFNISNINPQKLSTPPFWIDMSKLFELYVLGKLKDKFGNDIVFQFQGHYGQPDFLLKKEGMKFIIDTKYKTYYKEDFKTNSDLRKDKIAKDIRQLSGYSRDIKIMDTLFMNNKIIPCLIIYPSDISELDSLDYKNLEKLKKENQIKEFLSFYKLGVRLPLIGDGNKMNNN